MTVSVADIHRWDPGDVREVFHATRSRAEAAYEAADGITQLPAFENWGGDAATAAQDANDRLRVDLDAAGNEALAVAHAASDAADGMERIKSALSQLESDASDGGYQIDPATSRVIPGPVPKAPMLIAIAEMAELQARLDAILADAALVDDDLASAINMATGQAPIPASAGSFPDSQPEGVGEDVQVGQDGRSVLTDLNRANNQALVDAMARVRAAQAEVDKAASAAYTYGPGSPEAEAALAQLPQLKQDLAQALDDLGKIPDYSGIHPNSIAVGPNGNVLFPYGAAGTTQQVLGTLKNGTGEIFDQGTSAYYTYKDGKLIATRFLDPGQATATNEPLLTAVTTAVGAGPLVKGGEGAWLGLRALFGREGADALAAVSGETVLPRAAELAAGRASSALDNLAAMGPGTWTPVTESMSARAAAYQVQVTGHPITEGYLVNGVKFDGFANGILTDTKGYYSQFIDDGAWKPWLSGEQALISHAQRQLAAAPGTPIQWVFAEADSAAVVSRMLAENNLSGIEILIVAPK
ncbi:hypothetical protein MDOR_10280 [Mycolicibacterium doricum]|uniref:Tox-REase-5 domain-containing protein n=1 Tax=Mycolicibacterium doricum TaxID=126673 RepID=A0A1X1SWF8_9MYCO|nr:Tox-REase-5 domain-containing protein [Mycolicibacterium doricum]MCV7269451.1 hypothetical protein [Mycolicibacterium doricum]ORV35224.1 hypothetical protein AWC01_00845 [Mycolicibacterium doricum]BBZ06859.1 hypothetical protein MDOR_10280 [Mycolicibacterium doricum]